MVVFGENWNPSETVRLTARILAKQVRKRESVLLFGFLLKVTTMTGRARLSILGCQLRSHPRVVGTTWA